MAPIASALNKRTHIHGWRKFPEIKRQGAALESGWLDGDSGRRGAGSDGAVSMMKDRLDQALTARGLVATRSQAESYIKLGKVTVNGKVETKPGYFVNSEAVIAVTAEQQYVSRAALKLASVAALLHVDFRDKVVLDVGSSTGGFTDYALRQGAKKVIAVEVGRDQLHPSLHGHERIELHEQTDVRQLVLTEAAATGATVMRGRPAIIIEQPDVVVIDVSFVSLRDILPHVATLCSPASQIVAMVKPQFEAAQSSLKHKGVIKNDRMRRDILKDFESWSQSRFMISDKSDSDVAGARGNLERFYMLRKLK